MSHETEEMMYVGPKPWHLQLGLTDELRVRSAGDEPVLAEEMLRLSGLANFRVEKRQGGFFSPSRNEWIEAGDYRYLVRVSNGKVLGTCKKNYQEYQPLDLVGFLDRFVEDHEIRYSTAGILRGGEKVWINALTPIRFDVRRMSGKVDRHLAYLMAGLDFTGAGSNTLSATATNVVCMNTYRMALSDGHTIRIPHKGNMDAQYDAARDTLKQMYEAAPKEQEALQLLADTPMNRKDFIEFSTSIFLGIDRETKEEVDEEVTRWFEKASDRSKTILRNKVADTTKLFVKGIGNEGVSRFDALQAFTEYFDHFDIGAIRDKVKRGIAAAKALDSAMDGRGAEVKVKVRERLLRVR